MFMLIIKERDFNSWKRSTQGLGEHSLTAEKIYWINFSATKRRFCLSLHYNAANSYLFVNGVEIIKFKAKVKTDPLLGVIIDPLCLGNVLKDFFNKWNEKKTELCGSVYDFSVDYNDIPVMDIKDIHKYLIKKNSIV